MRCLIVDGNSILNRAFYGIRLLTTRDHIPTNAIYGTLNILLKIISDEGFEGVCVCFDRREKTFRHEAFEGYKAKRRPMPDELAAQLPIFKDVLDAMGICRLELAGFEADDLIGTASRMLCEEGCDPVILTGDRDSLQLIDDYTMLKLVLTRGGKSETIDYDHTRVLLDYGFEPIRIIDLKALGGDPSDNIPGVAGVGEKTALDLVSRFGGIEEIYRDLDSLDIRDNLREKLRKGRESAFLSYKLATITRDCPIELTSDMVKIEGGDPAKLHALLERLELQSIIKRLELKPAEGVAEPEIPEVTSEYAVADENMLPGLLKAFKGAAVDFYPIDGLDSIMVRSGGQVWYLSRENLGMEYDGFLAGFFSGDVRKRGHELKTTQLALIKARLPFDGFVFDTMLAAYVLNVVEGGYDLEKIAYKQLGIHLETLTGKNTASLPDGERLSIASRCVGAIGALSDIWGKTIAERGLERLYYDMELPLSEVIASMEETGFLIDKEALEAFREELSASIDDLQGKIFVLAGGEFNINSTKQLGEVLFERLGLTAVRRTKSGYSTDVEVLKRLQDKHEIIGLIMSYRSLTKLKSTYADGLLKVISDDGRIHSSFNQVGTVTGRISSSEPNMQNIPVRQEYGSRIRRMFTVRPGYVLADADYSQIELRILAHIAGDRLMSEAFRSGYDIHSATAARVFNVPMDEVTSQMRSRAKAINFGIVYGISDFSLSEDMGVSRYEARSYMDGYFEKYSGVRDYMKMIVKKAKEQGYVETMFGRRRYLPEIRSSNFNVRSAAERIALNTPIQGTAADIIKFAMVGVYRGMKREGLKSRLILQVHDELIIECPPDELERVKVLLKSGMENAVSLDVPLDTEVSTGENWLAAK